jgi:hypothetical protein
MIIGAAFGFRTRQIRSSVISESERPRTNVTNSPDFDNDDGADSGLQLDI